MRGYINHDADIKRLTAAAKAQKLDINKDILDSTERLSFVGVPGLTMRRLAEDPVIDVFTRVVNYARSDWSKFRSLLESCYNDVVGGFNDSLLDGAPIVTLHPTQHDKVYVYTTLVMSSYDPGPFYWARPSRVKQGTEFVKTYFEDIQDAKRKLAWSPISRAKSRILRRELVDVSRALTRYFPQLKSNLSTSQLRDLATAMVEYNAPIELSYADTDPTHFYDMYKNGPDSCMKDNGSRPFSWMARLPKPIHPTSVFAYSPYVKGVFLKRGDKVLARSFLYDVAFFGNAAEAKKAAWAHGRLYGATEKYTRIFATALSKEGYRDMGTLGLNMGKEYEITVPPIVVSEAESATVNVAAGEYMYVPYLDNHGREVNVTYDEDNSIAKVKFGAREKDVNCVFGSQHGFLPMAAFRKLTCHGCGGDIKLPPGKTPMFAADGAVFHDKHCATAAGYVYVVVGAGPSTTYMRADNPTLTVDPYNNNQHYSPSGRTAYNILPMITSLYEDLEGLDIFTGGGCIAKVGSSHYRVLDHLISSIPSSKRKEIRDDHYGFIWQLDDSLFKKDYLSVKTVRTVMLEDDHEHIDTKDIRSIAREIELIAA
jgi:hypothetical protein